MASTGRIPDANSGMDYNEFMSRLSMKRDVQRYFEVGVNAGGLMSQIHASVAVDPAFVLSANIASHKKVVSLIYETSDPFFASYDYSAIADGASDLCVLDGLHTFDCFLRDL